MAPGSFREHWPTARCSGCECSGCEHAARRATEAGPAPWTGACTHTRTLGLSSPFPGTSGPFCSWTGVATHLCLCPPCPRLLSLSPGPLWCLPWDREKGQGRGGHKQGGPAQTVVRGKGLALQGTRQTSQHGRGSSIYFSTRHGWRPALLPTSAVPRGLSGRHGKLRLLVAGRGSGQMLRPSMHLLQAGCQSHRAGDQAWRVTRVLPSVLDTPP